MEPSPIIRSAEGVKLTVYLGGHPYSSTLEVEQANGDIALVRLFGQKKLEGLKFAVDHALRELSNHEAV